jgi:hypothetical protein
MDYTLHLDASLEQLPELPGFVNGVSVFGTKQWLEAHRSAIPLDLQILRIYEKDVLKAYLPINTVRKGPWIRAYTPITQFSGGPYYLHSEYANLAEAFSQKRKIWESILQFMAQHFQASYLLPADADPRPALELGWKAYPRCTLICNLDQWSKTSPARDVRANLGKAQRNGLVLCPMDDSMSGPFAQALDTVYVRKNRTGYPAVYLTVLREAATQRNLVENWAVLFENVPICFASVAPDPGLDSAQLWLTATLPEGLKRSANSFLFNALIQHYKDRFSWIDFCGADHRGVYEFKEKFATKLVVLHQYERFQSKAHQYAFNAFSQIKSVIK